MVPDEFGHFPEYREVTGTPSGSVWALLGLSGKEEEAAKVGAPPIPIRIGVGGRPPFPSPSLLLPSSPTPTREGGILLPPGVGLPPRARDERAGPPPPPLLYIWGRGHPLDMQVDCLAVCGAPLHRFPPCSYRCSA